MLLRCVGAGTDGGYPGGAYGFPHRLPQGQRVHDPPGELKSPLGDLKPPLGDLKPPFMLETFRRIECRGWGVVCARAVTGAGGPVKTKPYCWYRGEASGLLR
eukprot:1194201-Prorocentrum_minimum.AAC.1